MKNHILTIMLLLVAGTAFTLRFFTDSTTQNICDILAFALPTLAAIVEIIVAERGNKRFEKELKKRPPFELLSEEEYERRKEEGTIDENT
ncbi:MAG: hypothetical protein IJ145_07455, partial [Prevotella sp.]|nr:hypothetical protein [Prevotella sp.]